MNEKQLRQALKQILMRKDTDPKAKAIIDRIKAAQIESD